MCLICLELDKTAMTAREARRALGEMRVKLEPSHIAEVEKKIAEAETELPDPPSAPTP